MKKFKFLIDDQFIGQRIDKVIAELSEHTRNRVQKFIIDGDVKLNNQVVSSNSYKIVGGEEVEVNISEPVKSKYEKTDIPLDIIYEDNDLLVINKQSGLTVHPGPGHFDDTLVNALLHHCGSNLSGVGGVERPGIVHRLDRDTSGLMVVAKNDKAHFSLAKQIEDRKLTRMYQAIVWGRLLPSRGVVQDNIGRDRIDRKKMKVVRHGGKSAITHYQVLGIYEKACLVKCILETGRTHQIRVHLSNLGHSIIGDQVYGHNSRKINKYLDVETKEAIKSFTRQALHSFLIEFNHPTTDERIGYEVGLPDDMKQVLDFISG